LDWVQHLGGSDSMSPLPVVNPMVGLPARVTLDFISKNWRNAANFGRLLPISLWRMATENRV
jgi:hypothetical protein